MRLERDVAASTAVGARETKGVDHRLRECQRYQPRLDVRAVPERVMWQRVQRWSVGVIAALTCSPNQKASIAGSDPRGVGLTARGLYRVLRCGGTPREAQLESSIDASVASAERRGITDTPSSGESVAAEKETPQQACSSARIGKLQRHHNVAIECITSSLAAGYDTR